MTWVTTGKLVIVDDDGLREEVHVDLATFSWLKFTIENLEIVTVDRGVHSRGAVFNVYADPHVVVAGAHQAHVAWPSDSAMRCKVCQEPVEVATTSPVSFIHAETHTEEAS